MKKTFTVYLAGPISGCTAEQARFWRQAVRKDQRWNRDFTFVDPTESLVGAEASPYELVERDLQAIERLDAVLVNMWKKSIGSAIGAVHARTKDKVVAVVDDINQALYAIRALLRGTTDIVVLKRNGAEEPFS